MHRRTFLTTGATVAALSSAGCSGLLDDPGEEDAADEPDGIGVETVAEGLTHPWGLAFLPGESGMLVTEREGELTLLDRDDGATGAVESIPEVDAAGQGGLLDVALHPDFGDEPWVYLTYAAGNDAGESTTHLGRGLLDADAGRLEGFEELYVVEPFVDSNGHFGSRVIFDDDALYVTTGDRQSKEFGPGHLSQDTTNDLGATLRLAPDGSVPEDNPSINEEASDAIYSYGHRNVQAMAFHPETDELW